MQNQTFQAAYNGLNSRQREAVDTIDGPVMVVAGPGTGKTQIIAARTANILQQSDVFPDNIFITTFTESGVIAIKERLVKFIGTEGYKVNVSTIHSFSQDVIKTFPEKFALEKTGKAIDEIDQIEIIKQILVSLIEEGKVVDLRVMGDDLFYLRDIKSNISNLKQEGVTPEKLIALAEKEYEQALQDIEQLQFNKRIRDLEKRKQKDLEEAKKIFSKQQELALLFKEYQKYLREKELYDFNDMIQFVLEKFRSDEDLRYHYAEKFQYIMLDEYQDTNNPQNEIISYICNPFRTGPEKEGPILSTPNIMVVGDDDQSIYRFQGANIENMLDFTLHYKETKIIVLTENYRSYQPILESARTLIENNSERLVRKIPSLTKELQAVKKGKEITPILYKAANEVDEEIYIIEKVKEFLEQGVEANEIALITRSNKEVENWSSVLKQAGLEVESKQKSNILTSPYIHFILDFFTFLENPYADDERVINLLLTHLIDVENLDIIHISHAIYTKNYNRRNDKIRFFDMISRPNLLTGIELEAPEKIETFIELYKILKSSRAEKTLLAFFSDFLTETKIFDFIDKEGNFDDIQDIFTLFDLVKSTQEIDKTLSLGKFLSKIRLYELYGFPITRRVVEEKKKGIKIMTAHSSKGLEYEAVIIPGLSRGNWDGKRDMTKLKLPAGIVGDGLQEEDKDEKKNRLLEEERRLFFVALTRAKHHLTITYPQAIGNKLMQASQFIEELQETIQESSKEAVPSQRNLAKSLKEKMLTRQLINIQKKEFEYIENFLRTYKLSASDLNTFLEDPKKFLYNTIFRYPFTDTEATIFGKVYHRTLELFFGKYIETGKWENIGYLTATFSHLIAREILTPSEGERLEKKGIEGLIGYYETYKGNFSAPLFLEYNFRQRNVYFTDIPLTGKIDKIIRLSDIEPIFGQKIPVGLIDYKTGSIKTENAIKGIDREGNKKESSEEGKYFRQLMFYRLLCENDREFSNHYEVMEAGLDYVEGKKGEYKILLIPHTDEEYQNFKNLVKETWEKISDIEFWKEILNTK